MASTEARQRWEAANRENLRAYYRAWTEANREYVNAKNRERVAADPLRKEKGRAAMAAWRAANPDKRKLANKKAYQKRKGSGEYRVAARTRLQVWRKQNPEATAAIHNRRHAAKMGAPGSGITRDAWAAIVNEFGHRCAYCAAHTKLTMDHVVPLSKGGAHDVLNVVPACQSCNSSKHDRNILQWLVSRAIAA